MSDGSLLTQIDRLGYVEADRLAKLAVEQHRAPTHIFDEVRQRTELQAGTAKWLGIATVEAIASLRRAFEVANAVGAVTK